MALIGDVFTPEVAREVMRAVMRDLQVQVKNGKALPQWAQPVLAALAEVADPVLSGSDSGTALARLEPRSWSTEWVTVAEAAHLVGRSEAYVRRLARSGRVRSHRAGARAWLVDPDSVRRVIDRAA